MMLAGIRPVVLCMADSNAIKIKDIGPNRFEVHSNMRSTMQTDRGSKAVFLFSLFPVSRTPSGTLVNQSFFLDPTLLELQTV